MVETYKRRVSAARARKLHAVLQHSGGGDFYARARPHQGQGMLVVTARRERYLVLRAAQLGRLPLADHAQRHHTSARADLLQAMLQHQLPAGRIAVEHRWKQASMRASAFKHDVPMTVHPGSGYDIMSCDGFCVPECVGAGLLKPLVEVVGPEVNDWEGWSHISEGIQAILSYQGERYGIPSGTDVRQIFYRKDLFEDPKEKEAFKAKYGMDLGVPQTWDEYLKQVEFFTKDGNYGVVNQGLRPDPIAMEWSNYLFANGAEYHDADWKPTINNAAGVAAMGIEKINFMWYLKHVSWLALVGFLAGAAVFILQAFFFA